MSYYNPTGTQNLGLLAGFDTPTKTGTKTVAEEQPFAMPERVTATEQPFTMPTKTVAPEQPFIPERTFAPEQPFIPERMTAPELPFSPAQPPLLAADPDLQKTFASQVNPVATTSPGPRGINGLLEMEWKRPFWIRPVLLQREDH